MDRNNVDTTVDRRTDVQIPVGGDVLGGWWYPSARAGAQPQPVVILAHGFGAVKHMRLWAYAERFADAGMHALVFDYRTFGDSTGGPRGLIDAQRQLEDWAAAIAYARRRPDVDTDKVALWGSSFAGGLVVMAASEDPRIAAVISQIPLADGSAGTGTMGRLQSLVLAGAALADTIGSKLGLPAIRVKASGAPGAVNAVLASPGALQSLDVMVPEGAPFTNRVCARIILKMPSYKPYKVAHLVQCPLLVQVMNEDELAPADVAARMASAAPHGRLERYTGDHFTPYVGEAFEAMIEKQIDFLQSAVTK